MDKVDREEREKRRSQAIKNMTQYSDQHTMVPPNEITARLGPLAANLSLTHNPVSGQSSGQSSGQNSSQPNPVPGQNSTLSSTQPNPVPGQNSSQSNPVPGQNSVQPSPAAENARQQSSENSQSSSHESESEFCQQLSPSVVLNNMEERDPETVFLEYKARSEMDVVDEIKTFVMIHNIKQQRIADMSGISQGYISKYFRGEGSEMSDRSKNQIIRWYIKYRDCPEKIFEFVPKEKETPIPPRPIDLINYVSPSTSVRVPSLSVTPIQLSPSPQSLATQSLANHSLATQSLATQSLATQSLNRLLPSMMSSPQSRFPFNPSMIPSSYMSGPFTSGSHISGPFTSGSHISGSHISGSFTSGSLRRQRFIFRKEHYELLEKYFRQNEYPDQFTKQKIVEELNGINADPHGRPLTERDKVSYAVVSTWFNNKRKERSRTNPQSSPSRGKGRPPRSEYCYPSGDDSRSQEGMKRARSVSPTEPDAIVSSIDFDDLMYETDTSTHVKVEGISGNGVQTTDGGHCLVDDVTEFDEYDDADYERFMNPRPDIMFKDCTKTYSRNSQPTVINSPSNSVNQPD